jgi:hypothetical protein
MQSQRKCGDLLDKGMTATKVGAKMDMTNQEVNNLVDAYEYAKDYLEDVGRPDEWSLVDKQQLAFIEAVKAKRKLEGPGRKELFDAVVGEVLATPASGERLYSYIPKIGTHIEAISGELEDDLELADEDEEPTDEVDIFLTGGDDVPLDSFSRVAKAVRETSEEKDKEAILETVQNTISSEEEKEKDHVNRNYVKKQVQKAASFLKDAAEHIGPEKDKRAVRENLDSISTSVATIQEWLDE